MAQASHQTPTTILRKLVFALLIFGGTYTLAGELRPLVVREQPLPGDDGVQGPCAVWFIGSSTVARWSTMARDMAPWRTENRGVGGALIGDLTARIETEKTPPPPGTVVIYVGDNDLAAGQPVEEVAAKLFAFIALVRERMPDTRLIVLGIKPSPARWTLRPQQLRLDQLLRDRFGAIPRISFADVGPSLLVRGRAGPYFVEDGIHLNAAGYAAWGGAVRRAVERSVAPDQVTRCTGPDAAKA